ncbi:TRAP transporter permease [Peptoniphilus catoniae]|uniref:TRAP transporter permease n=1 Tax=Peptoniphilus catoniae TaxID=1660341 RepID=UPI0010FCEE94|nr:TRAP transporter fused permease subunit [Peptoniphilus catoniae]
MKKFIDKIEFNRDNTFISIILCLWVAIQIIVVGFLNVDDMFLRCIHIIFVLIISSLLFKDLGNFLKISLSILSVFSFLYVIFNYTLISKRGGYTYGLDVFVAGLGILLVLVIGFKSNKNLSLLALFFLTYLYWGKFLPGSLSHGGFSLKRVLNYLFWGTGGIFGIGVGVSASYIFLFVIFGSFLKYSGFSNFINDLSMSLIGKSKGGPAKVAVVASACMGMINGSAVANVATTGTITIPLMKKTGYDSDFAGAVEAVASTGGQFCPPIMGAAAFVMAEFLQIPYTQVLMAAIVPAFLFYLSLLLSVHLEAEKLGLKGISIDKKSKEILKSGFHLLIPLVILIVMMLMGYSPITCGIAAIFATIISSHFKKETAMNLETIIEASKEGALSALNVAMACILIGLIIGSVALSGLGLKFGSIVLSIVGNSNIYFGAFMVMILSIILGMGVPGVAAYVIVVSVAVPIMIKAGASPISAHMFCLIYACLSNITPPVAISSYVASSIADSDMVKTSLKAVKLGLGGFILPFFFIKNQDLLLQSTEIFTGLRVVLGAAVGILSFTVGMEGYLYRNLNKIFRCLFIFAGILLIDTGVYTDLIALTIIIFVFIYEKRCSYEKKI